jgi:hypothetical protein
MNKLKTYNIIFYAIAAAGIVFILFSNPFLIKFYDPWRFHLKNIADFYNGQPGIGRTWHLMWANIFKLLGISDIFLWAKIIHVCQFLLAAFLVYYFSKTVLGIMIESFCGNSNHGRHALRTIQLKFLSLFSVFLWFIGNGTFSVAYQQAWILWYSVTYQGLTIPLLWYCTALTLKLFYTELSLRKILFYIVLTAIASVIMAKFHPMEFLYYCINLVIVLVLNSKLLFNAANRKYVLVSLPVIVLIMVLTVKFVIDRESGLSVLFTSEQAPGHIIQTINSMGNTVVSSLNRFSNSFSELARISLLAAVLFRIMYVLRKYKSHDSKAMHVYDYLMVSSFVFAFIPIIPFLAGTVGFITNPVLVWRCFFGSPWFLFLPFILAVIIRNKTILTYLTENPIYQLLIKNKTLQISSGKKFILPSIIVIIVAGLLIVVPNSNPLKRAVADTLSFKTTILNAQSILHSLERSAN